MSDIYFQDNEYYFGISSYNVRYLALLEFSPWSGGCALVLNRNSIQYRCDPL